MESLRGFRGFLRRTLVGPRPEEPVPSPLSPPEPHDPIYTLQKRKNGRWSSPGLPSVGKFTLLAQPVDSY